MMRKRHELRVMCDAKIEINIIYGERDERNFNSCAAQDELEVHEDKAPSSNG